MDQKRFTFRIVFAWIVASLFCFSGCLRSTSYSISIFNHSGERLNDVAVSDGTFSFPFGVISNTGEATFMNANVKFGKAPPKDLTISFTLSDGETNKNASVSLSNVTSKIQIEIGKDLSAKQLIEKE